MMAGEPLDSSQRAVDGESKRAPLNTSPTILVVDDDRDLAGLYATWLPDAYTVQTAYGGADGLEQMDETIDIVLLDRQMPDLSGDAVLRQMREQGCDCPVAMVTGVEPDFDILEMCLEIYLVKAIEWEVLEATVERLLALDTYEAAVQDYFVLASKLAALQSTKDKQELQKHDAYARVQSKLARLKQQVDTQLEDLLELGEIDELFQRLACDQDDLGKTLSGGRRDDF